MVDCSVIPASEGDIPTIRQIAELSWQQAYAEILSPEQIRFMLDTMYSPTELRKHLNSGSYEYYLVNSHGISAGFMGIEWDAEPESVKLQRLYFLPQKMGKGLGSFAFHFLEKTARDRGYRRIILNVNKRNSARNVYEKWGFRQYGDGVFDIGDGFFMDDFLMEKNLK